MQTETAQASQTLSQFSLAVRELSAASRSADVIDILRRATRALTRARGVTVVAREGDLCHYLADDSESALWPDQRFPMEACISGWAMLEGAPAVVSDIYEDERIPHDVYRPTFVRSLVMTPIGERPPFAAFGAYWDHVRQHPEGDLHVLETLAACAAGAFERIWLAQELEKRSNDGSAAPPDTEVLARVLERDAEALGQRLAAIGLAVHLLSRDSANGKALATIKLALDEAKDEVTRVRRKSRERDVDA